VDSLQTIFLVGVVGPLLLRSGAILAVIALAILAFTVRKTRMRLD
jgi:hypothetical protein